jgi:hypothetical protein
VLDTENNIFGGFTHLRWEEHLMSVSEKQNFEFLFREDLGSSFLFTLRNPYGLSERIFPLQRNRSQWAIQAHSNFGPTFGWDLGIADHSDSNRDSWAQLGSVSVNPTNLPDSCVLTDLLKFTVKEIEVFEIHAIDTDAKSPP